MSIKTLLLAAIGGHLLSGCSAKELYNAGKKQQETHCNQYVGHERAQCLQDINHKSYEVYQQERQQVIKGEVDEQ
ncbi:MULTISPECIES: hypothetical protein [Thalassotalea]|uniref:Lipoprotein n=1 Tax=Thalassotalea castellviae TaxID=3075612 RepID=A0ABU3A2Z2_9GAMM|nr:hypothetical protein [Thalassotalea sp. W431]MDT0604175.1 hypothetical protein [Thalassotalea sp. W431]